MKKIFSLGLAALLTAGLATSCKDDVLNGDGVYNPGAVEDDGIRMYIAGTLALPTQGSRSATEDVGENGDPTWGNTDNNQTNSNAGPSDFELGYDYENNIKSVLLVFADKDKEFIAHSVVTGISQTPTVTKDLPMTKGYDLEVTGEIKHSDLVKAYKNGLESDVAPIVYVYAFCNYTSRMLERFQALAAGEPDPYADPSKPGAKWYDWEGIVEEDPSPAGFTPLTQNSIWSKDSFLMSNAKDCKVTFPKSISEWDEYADKSTPFIIGEKQTSDAGEETIVNPIEVERVAARIDFRDGSNYVVDGKKVPNTYPIYVDANNDGKTDNNVVNGKKDLNIISVTLNRMCLVNMSKNYYYLRRVSTDGTNQAPIGLSGIEHNKNFVVDYDWEVKQTVQGINADNEADYFNFPLYTTDEQSDDKSEGIKYNRFGWFTDRIQEDFLDKNPDHDTWQDPQQGSGYSIWRYVTENTIPQAKGDDDPQGQQKTVQSTGIVFKGRIVPGKDIDDPNASTYMSANVIEAIRTINDPNYDPSKPEYADKCPFLYSYNNILYAGHEEMIEKANEDGNNGPLHHVVNQILANWKYDKDSKSYKYAGVGTQDGTGTIAGKEVLTVEAYKRIQEGQAFNDGERTVEIDEDQFIEEAPLNDVTVYRPYNEDEYDVNGKTMGDGWGYYCYYFYWNRHNDNNKSGLMGNMEFATVRNNVYKLYVDNISKLGHPRMRKHDPDPVDPEDPDEDPLNYIKVVVKVLPWVVRENKITFN